MGGHFVLRCKNSFRGHCRYKFRFSLGFPIVNLCLWIEQSKFIHLIQRLCFNTHTHHIHVNIDLNKLSSHWRPDYSGDYSPRAIHMYDVIDIDDRDSIGDRNGDSLTHQLTRLSQVSDSEVRIGVWSTVFSVNSSINKLSNNSCLSVSTTI